MFIFPSAKSVKRYLVQSNVNCDCRTASVFYGKRIFCEYTYERLRFVPIFSPGLLNKWSYNDVIHDFLSCTLKLLVFSGENVLLLNIFSTIS